MVYSHTIRHFNHASLKEQHVRAFREANADLKAKAEKDKTKPTLFRSWALYSFRHTFLTRLGESGCDARTLARIAGHSSMAISNRYVHHSEDAVLNAIARLGGHKFGHSAETKEIAGEKEPLQLAANNERCWRARRDSNSRPIAPEAIALSS